MSLFHVFEVVGIIIRDINKKKKKERPLRRGKAQVSKHLSSLIATTSPIVVRRQTEHVHKGHITLIESLLFKFP